MARVVGSPRNPNVARMGCPAPGEVLFRRGVTRASVAAPGGEEARSASASCSVGKRQSQRIPVESVLRLSCSVPRPSVASVASEFVVSQSASRRVASEHGPSERQPDRGQSPPGLLSRVMRMIRRRSFAAKVADRQQRLLASGDAVPGTAERHVPVALRSQVQVASQSLVLSRRVGSVAYGVGRLRSSESSQRARVVH